MSSPAGDVPAPPVRWGFLGAGFIASKAVAPALHAAEGAVLQVAGARAADRALALGPVRASTSYEEVCEADDVDAVYVCLPNHDHLPWVSRALAAGKHVLCEKPLGLDPGEVAQMVEASERSGRLLVEAAWNRWHPRTARLLELLPGLPAPRDASAWFTFPGDLEGNYRLDPDRGGGALLDVGCYAVGLALEGVGPGQVSVTEVAQRVGPTGVDLSTSALLAGEYGSARVRCSFVEQESQGFQVAAPGVSLELGGPAFTSWHEPSTLRIVEEGHERVEQFAACDPYQLMLEAVSARIRGRDAWVLPLTTSVAVAAAVDAIARAAAPSARSR
jgi:xylose dehydrogenase (NAD/NADP)